MNYIAVSMEDTERKDMNDARRCAASVKKALHSKGITAEIVTIDKSYFFKDGGKLKHWLKNKKTGVIFNLFEGFGNDSFKEVIFVRELEKENIRYTGNSSKTLEQCLDKPGCKQILTQHGVPVPAGIVVREMPDLRPEELQFPVFVKPASEDASVGIDRYSLCRNKTELREVIQMKLRSHPGGLLIEEFINGDEYNAAFTGKSADHLLAVSMIDYNEHPDCLPFISYESKWDESSTDFRELNFSILKESSPLKKTVTEISAKAAEVLNCTGYFRVDLRESAGKFHVLDVNPNPDINEDAGFARQAGAAGHSYPDLIETIFRGAFYETHE